MRASGPWSAVNDPAKPCERGRCEWHDEQNSTT
jgi:hypothetical protein